MVSNYIISIVALFSFILLLHFHLRRGRSPRGPLALPIIGHLHLIKQPLHQSLSAISAIHGSVISLRFGSRSILLVSSAAAAQQCFTINDVIFANRPALLAGKHFGYNHSMIGVAPYGEHWRNLRRFTTLHALSSSRLSTLSSFFSGEVHSLLRRLFSDTSPTVDLRSHLWNLTMNIIMGMIADKKYYGTDTTTNPNPNPNEGMRFRRIVEEVFELSGAACMEDFIPAMKWFSGMEKKMEKLGKEMDELLQELVDERRRSWSLKSSQEKEKEKEKEKRILIDVMLGLQELHPEEYTDTFIKGMIIALILAGTDSTSGSMEWAMALLLNHPETMKKVKCEIHEHIGHERLVRDTDIPKLKYLNSVIKETLRMYPPAPLLIPHEASEDCTISGIHVPKNTILLVNVYAIQRDPKLWSSPMDFKPERFEKEEEEEGGERGFMKYIPFGYGRRRCPGEGMGMRVMALALASMIQCFEWERINEDEMVNLDEGHGLTMPMANPLHAKHTPCTHMLHILSQL
ncbi:hypothetical protein J5N97_025396 [Dioscorea zingiberensis]|uniref:Cytochrome P450 n=1 Tax=Dioscorea zingiberensis TaxID=325984 RepID=A0A9D5H9L5_9LILI|nr:hypothetical protein J5N97_025396 [Dioscorea zingiberensis]